MNSDHVRKEIARAKAFSQGGESRICNILLQIVDELERIKTPTFELVELPPQTAKSRSRERTLAVIKRLETLRGDMQAAIDEQDPPDGTRSD